MIDFLTFLEPVQEESGEIMYNQLEEITEIFFVEEGEIDIGFKVNEFTRFVVRITAERE